MLLFELILSTVRCTILAIDIASKSVVSRGTRYGTFLRLQRLTVRALQKIRLLFHQSRRCSQRGTSGVFSREKEGGKSTSGVILP